MISPNHPCEAPPVKVKKPRWVTTVDFQADMQAAANARTPDPRERCALLLFWAVYGPLLTEAAKMLARWDAKEHTPENEASCRREIYEFYLTSGKA